jgi:hypothetical protein
MNAHPEAAKARHDAQQEMLSVIEAMMDGDAHDAQTHLVRWRDRNRYALQLERPEATTNAVSPEAEEAANLRLLLAECFERLEYREYCGGLPDSVQARVVRALANKHVSLYAPPTPYQDAAMKEDAK